MITHHEIISGNFCPYCGTKSKIDSASNLRIAAYGYIRYCDCDDHIKYTECKPESNIPLGTLANAELRALRQKTLTLFNKLVAKSNSKKETHGNKWMHSQLNWSMEQLYFTEPSDCRNAIKLIEKYL